jgi:PBP1b-binding outer membrane lipoprotein LpoB
MKKALLLLLAMLVLAGCQGGPANTDGYVRNHEPKTGGPDL